MTKQYIFMRDEETWVEFQPNLRPVKQPCLTPWNPEEQIEVRPFPDEIILANH